jgi:hypothetical protein
MIRRSLLAFLVFSLVLITGCGMMMLAKEGEPVWLRSRVSRTFVEPSHRVALATLEVLKDELGSVKDGPVDVMTRDSNFDPPGGGSPKPSEVQIPDNYPAFWLDGLATGPTLVNYRVVSFSGKTLDGRPVEAVVRVGAQDRMTSSVVSIQVGRRGDEEISRNLLDKIADRVAHPTYKPGSPEESQALQTAFGPGLGEEEEMAKAVASGEPRIKKN